MASISRAARRGTAVLAAAAVSCFAAMPAASAVPAPVIVPAADQLITSSSLEWGVRESFRSYIQGPIAQGEWTVTGASADTGGIVTWQGGAGEFDPETGVGSASFSGGVHYTGHWDHFTEGEPALSVEIENPTVEIEGTTGTLYADIEAQSLDQQTMGGTQVALAELSLPGGVDAEEDYVSAVATAALTADGAEAFAGFYESGEELDPLSFSFALAPAPQEQEEVEEPQEGEEPAEETPSAEEAEDEPVEEESAAEEVPAPEEAEPSGSSGSGNAQNSSNNSGSSSSGNSSNNSGNGNSSSSGNNSNNSGSSTGSGNSGGSSSSSNSSNSESNTSNASGSTTSGSSSASSSNTSTPNAAASSSGVSNSGGSSSSAPAAGTAPAESSVLNSSVLPEQEEAVTTEVVCTGGGVSGGTLNWGVRESFRSYIQGGIAQGDWTLNGVSYTGGQYVWSGGAGNFDADAGTGTVGFSGGVHFTGHDGLLDLRIDNPAIQVTGPNSAALMADVVSTTMDGDRIDLTGVTFASISGAIDVGGDTASASGASATLTSEGADAFAGFYEPGEALDPISFTFPLTEECQEVTLGADGQPIAGGSSGGGQLAQTGSTVGDLALGSAALLAVGLTLMVLKRRRHSETVTITAA